MLTETAGGERGVTAKASSRKKRIKPYETTVVCITRDGLKDDGRDSRRLSH